ncbi:MAG: penicillin-binding protein 2 [Candidatus Nealsonbacteria bacterium]|nr:penicillin-binding protein 2 [Candidatus Nealsonbacteria bacterium]
MFKFHSLKKINPIKGYFISNRTNQGHNIEPQEVFLDNLAKKREAELGISEKRFEVPLSKKILQTSLVFIIILVLLLFGKTFQLQVFENDFFSVKAQQNKFIVRSIQAARGVIYDSRGKQLVFNKPGFDLVLDIKNLPVSDIEKEKVLKEISKIIGQNPEEIKNMMISREKNNKILISQNLSHQKLILLETRIDEFPGFQIEQNPSREYLDGENFAHLIGYTGQETAFEYVGKDGLESFYEETLRKNSGKLRFERDARGNIISKEVISLPGPGKSLVLWLDSELQNKIKEVLEKILNNIGSKKAAAVALNPKNGGVLSLLSLPAFDNNLFSRGADQDALRDLLLDPKGSLFNRVISGLYPTGSIIKPLIATAALEEKIIAPDKQIYAGGKIEIPHRYDPSIIYTFGDLRVHGMTDIRKAIAASVNVYFYIIGGGYEGQKGLGPSKIKEWLELFNWAERTGLDLPGESIGLIPSPEWKRERKNENWWDGDTYNLSIGQGDLLITPLQVAASFVAIANGGILYKPKVVKEIIDSERNLVEEIKPEVLRENFIDPKNLQVIREGMRNAVTGQGAPFASAVILNSLSVPIAAKTGTAQTPKPNYYHNWITVFAPYEEPEIVLTIMIEDVKDIQAAALPAAREILEWYFSR